MNMKMMTNREIIADEYPELLVLDPEYFDEAIVGVVTRIGLQAVCYKTSHIIDLLMEKEGMDEEEAIDYFEYNIAGSYMGEFTPVFLSYEILD